MTEFTNTWFKYSELSRDIYTHLYNLNEKRHILEIGSHEGASAYFFSNILLHHPESSLTCVDPYDIEDKTTPVTVNTKSLFLSNISYSSNHSKVSLLELYSNDFYKINTQMFDFIYIDGSHKVEDVINDFINCFNILTINGVLWFDDYGSGDIKQHIDLLYNSSYSEKLIIIHQGYQIGFRKI